MKSIELFCASPASTAICSSTVDQKAIIRHGIRSIDRHIHRLGETPARRRKNAPPCSSHLPFDPSYRKPTKISETFRRKSSADADDRPTSSRYLLSDKPFVDNSVSDYSSTKPLIKDNRRNYTRMNPDAFPAFRSMSTRSAYQSPVYDPFSLVKIQNEKLSDHLNARKSTSPPANHQVIVLRVSIHCKGCEGKLRKHISRMEGVTSFSIDLATKKVTVIGDVTPVSVLTSISKVKNAQFWPSPTSSSSSTSSSSYSSPSPRLTLSTS